MLKVPPELCAPRGPFLRALDALLHPAHGTVVVNLHGDMPPPNVLECMLGRCRPGFSLATPQGRLKLGALARPARPGRDLPAGKAPFDSRGALRQSRSKEPGRRGNTSRTLAAALMSEAASVGRGLGFPFSAKDRAAIGLRIVDDVAVVE
eukprot:jgi/Mesen1/3047/ME000018S02361